MKRVGRIVGWVVAILALAYFAQEFRKQFANLPTIDLSWASGSAALGSILIYIGLTLVDGAAWVLLLRGTGASTSLGTGLVVFSIAQFGKYAPGNVAQHLGRIYLAGSYGVSAARTVFTMGVEAATAVLVGIALIAGSMLASSVRDDSFALPVLHWRLLVATVVAIVGLPLALYSINRFRPWPVKRILGDQRLALPRAPALLLYIASHAGSFLLMSLATELVARYVFHAPEHSVLLVPGVLAIAWLSGFLVPGVPAGLGVREAVLITGLGSIYGPGIAAGVTVATRLLSAAADALLFGAGLVARRFAIGPDHAVPVSPP